jgi:probable phosphoglycerate mutase
MSECILVRHAQTDWNKKQIFRGRAEVELNRTGIRHAEKTSTLLSEVNAETIYTSPLKRSLVTAQILGRPHNLKPKEVNGLIDIDYGDWQGLLQEDVQRDFPAVYQKWREEPDKVKFPGGESLKDVRDRAIKVFEEALLNCNFFLLVSHRVVIKVILLHVLDLPLSSFWKVRQDPCAISRVERTPSGLSLISMNEGHHLYKPSKERREDF